MMARGPLWTPEQHHYIRRALAAGVPVVRIAADLNRTARAVEAQIHLHDLAGGPRRRGRRPRWTIRPESTVLPFAGPIGEEPKGDDGKLRLCCDRRVVRTGSGQKPYTATHVLPGAFDPDEAVRGWMARHLRKG